MGIAALASAKAASAREWFCVRSQAKQEHVAAANLRGHPGLEVLNPRLRFKRATVRGSAWVLEPVLPHGFRGVGTRILPARDRVVVLMDLFGRQTTLEVGLTALINKRARFANQLI